MMNKNMDRTGMKNYLLLICGVIINGFAVSIFVKSKLGVSTVSSIPLIMSLSLKSISLGVATILFQIVLLLILISLRGMDRKYLFSLAIGSLFGFVVDFWNSILHYFPLEIVPNYLLMIIAILVLPFGISLTILSNLAAIPFDIFVKDLAQYFKKPISQVKTIFDLICVSITAIVSLSVFGQIHGLGVATLISMLITGKLIGIYMKVLK